MIDYTKPNIRPEFRKMIKNCKTVSSLADFLSCTSENVRVQIHRGYLSLKFAERAERRSGGKYKERLLVKK